MGPQDWLLAPLPYCFVRFVSFPLEARFPLEVKLGVWKMIFKMWTWSKWDPVADFSRTSAIFSPSSSPHSLWLSRLLNLHPLLCHPSHFILLLTHLVLLISDFCQSYSPLPHPSKFFLLRWFNVLLPSQAILACPNLSLLLTSVRLRIVPQ